MSSIFEGLERVYHFNGGFNDSLNKQDFTSYGAVIVSTGQKLGSGAVSLDGVDDYLQASDAGLAFGNTARTVNSWIYRRDDGGSVIFMYGNQNVNGYFFTPFTSAADGYYLAVNFYGHGWGITTNVVPLNTWVMVTFRYPNGATSSDQLEIFANAVKQTPTTLWGAPVSVNTQQTGNCYVGKNWVGTLFANMLVDELCFWNRALTDAEISYLYHNGLGREIRNIRQGIDYGIGRGIAA